MRLASVSTTVVFIRAIF